jgi:oligopeptidase B
VTGCRYRRGVEDPHRWLHDRDDPRVVAHLEAENARTAAWFAPHEPLVEAVFGEIRSRTQETDASVPVPHGPWWYLRQTVEGREHPVHRRGPTAETADRDLVLDVDAEAAGHEHFDVGLLLPSPDHRLVAWSCDTIGAERYTIRFRDVASGTDLDDRIEGVSWGGAAWSSDGAELLHVLPDAAQRPHRVMRHRLGTSQEEDLEVLVEPDERFFVGVGATRSGALVLIGAASKTTSEVRVLPADDPGADPVVVAPRRDGVEYDVDHWGDRLVIRTNLDAEDFRVVTAPLDAPGEWTELIPHEPGRMVQGVQAFADHLVVHEWADMQPRLRVRDRDGTERLVPAPDGPHDIGLGPNRIYDTDVLRVVVESLVDPPRVVDVDVRTGEQVVRKQHPTPGVDLGAYVAERLWATAEDGVRVPVDVVRHRATPVDGTAACVLYGYGAYEVSVPTHWSTARLSLLDRGVVWALAHPRGGGEGGRRWYTAGKLLRKRTTFTDTLAVADHLVEAGWCAPDRLAVRGASAGGLLVGACVTMRPERFAAAVAEVPFVDVVTTMSDPSLPLTVTEWEEWGDPREEPYASYIASYSPYDNTVEAAYPAMYVTAGLHDPRVQFHEPAKWVARLREVDRGGRPVLLRTELGAGHGGPSGRYRAWREEARTLAFLLVALGAVPSGAAAPGP